MLRKFLTFLTAALVVVTALGGSATATSRTPTKMVTVAGPLEFVTDLTVPHYEVAGYVLLYGAPQTLTTLVGNDVLVTGTEVTGPSIYMRKALDVLSIGPKPPSQAESAGDQPVAIPAPVSGGTDPKVTIPVIVDPAPATGLSDPKVTIPVIVDPLPTVGGSDPKVTIPVITHPLPGLNTPVTVPTPPAPFFGTPFYLLFGRLQSVQNEYYVVDPADGHVRYWVRSSALDLAPMVGQLVGTIASPESLPNGDVRYLVLGVVVLSRDLAGLIPGGGLIFQLPAGEIIVRLHGQVIHLDPAPIMGNGRTLVGLRAIAEAMGATVRWDDSTKTAAVVLGDREVSVTLGSNRVVIHQKGQADTVVTSDIAAIINGGRVMIPLRILSEGLGLTVNWDAATRTIDLN